MKEERTFDGLEVTLRPTGGGRFLGAGFLTVWLLFWALGECLVLWLLIMGGWALLTGQPPEPGRAPLAVAPSLFGGGFMILWLAFWTVGGIAAINEWLRLVWSRDRLVVRPDGLDVIWHTGPFRKREHIARPRLRRIHHPPQTPNLLAETDTAPVDLTRHGQPAELIRLAALLAAELRLPANPENLSPILPTKWREVIVAEGGTAVVADPATRRTQARVAWIVTLPLCAGTTVIISAAVGDTTLWALAAIAAALSAAAVYGSLRLSRGRDEWLLEPGRLVVQRRFGRRLRVRATGLLLELHESRDSDGDSWTELMLVPTNAAPDAKPGRFKLVSSLHEGLQVRQLAAWLAARIQLPVTDLTTPQAKAADLAALTRQLEASGRFGRWVVRLLRRRTRKES